MANINAKSTKTEIMEAYLEQKEKIDQMMAAKDDPVENEKISKQKVVLDSAEKIAGTEILNDAIVKQYRDICEAVGIKKAELENLYGVEVELNTMVALINSHKDKTSELSEQYETAKAKIDKDLSDRKAAIEDDISLLNKERLETVAEIKKETLKLKVQLEQEREREEEEYTYNRNRIRKIAENEWTDEESLKRKDLDDRERSVNERENTIIEKEDYVSDLEMKVEEIPTCIEHASAEGYEKGKADAGRSWGFEKRSMEQKNEYEVMALTDKVSRLESDLSEAKNTISTLQDKLDAAYTQMRELAADTVKSNGGVKILDRDNGGK